MADKPPPLPSDDPDKTPTGRPQPFEASVKSTLTTLLRESRLNGTATGVILGRIETTLKLMSKSVVGRKVPGRIWWLLTALLVLGAIDLLIVMSKLLR